MSRSSLGILPTAVRLRERDTFGDLQKMLEAAAEERRAGRIHNACAAYREALGQWLRLNWIARSGRVNTNVTDAHAFLQKLRSGNHLDAWSYAAIERALAPLPKKLSFRNVDILAGIVLAVCADRYSTPADALSASSRYSQLEASLWL